MAKLSSIEFSESSKPPKSSKSLPPTALIVRFVLIGVLIIAVVVLILDRKAQSAAKSFANQLSKSMDDQQSLSTADVQKLAGRKPAKAYNHPSAHKRFIEEYTWSGGFRTNIVYCYYQVAAAKLLEGVAVNNPQH